MGTAAPRVAMVAGETSGDLLAGLLLGGMKARWPELTASGIGGPRMAALGFQAHWPYEKLAVHGFNLEVLRRFREIWGIREQLAERLRKERPDVFIGVDAPDFNLGLEARLKTAGIKTVHFVSPSIWAWRGGRINKIHQSVDHMLCLFPFEPQLYHDKGIAATFVGHPLADTFPLEVPREAARARLGLPVDAPVVAVLPGSRGGEIRHIAPTFLQTIARLSQMRPDLRFVLPVVPGMRGLIDPMVAEHVPDKARLMVLDGQSHDALAACDVTLIASGTATLEAALFKRPMVIAYKISALSWPIMKRMAYLPWVGLPNILLRDFVVPERLQHDANPEQLATDVLAWLDQPARAQSVQQRFLELHHTLRRNTAQAASDAIAQVLESH
ncbi:MAG TPA: lipid-A-disaccharide synthase [Aquabacterium sp.]|uniref:lipid-A-disaccharide synthase n=1 Tax=Aquabacterium sp. TaxID=1872578 RepID=UPI002E33F500|nr:lipid-A-disaccharide synthase [Aquabacterium sp.]HEX5357875.1 lipid-A-disaccharide synthase [Aquabacterium sp.]